MRRTWLLAFLFLTLWQMLPHEGYNMLYAQDMGNESYGGGYNCEDDDGFGAYYSSLPCEDTPCVTTCPDCQVTLACDDLDDHACAGNITCSACGKSMTSEEYHNHNCHSSWSGGGYDEWGYTNPPEENTPTTTNSSNTTQSSQGEENTWNSNFENSSMESNGDVTVGERYWEDKTNCISPNTLKFMTDVNTIDYLPDSFVPQGSFPDCVARAFATSIYLLSNGDLSQYELAYDLAWTEAKIKGTDLTKDGIEPDKFDKFLGDAFVIQTLSPDEYTKDTIFNYINNNKPVISSMDTDYSIPLRHKGVHAVTIVAYDLHFYYCAYGENDVVKIPHSEIGKYPIYVTTGLK